MKNSISRLFALILTASLILVVNPSFALAWDQHPDNYKTHQEINKEALLRFYTQIYYLNNDKYKNSRIDVAKSFPGPEVVSNTTFENPPIGTADSSHKVELKSHTFEAWVKHGGYSADEPNFWASVRHFYNPIPDNGPPELNDQTAFKARYWSISAREWAFTSADNPFSWKKALDYYKRAMEIPEDSAIYEIPGSDFRDPALPVSSPAQTRETYLGKSFRSLGETMHMLADLVEPAHVRNDSHPFFDPDPLEAVIKDYHVRAFAKSVVDPRIGSKIDAAVDAVSIYDAMAEYTNKYFYSEDTIYDKDSGVLPNNGEEPYLQPQFRDLIWDNVTETYSDNFTFLDRLVPMVQKTYWYHVANRSGTVEHAIEMTDPFWSIPPHFAVRQAQVLLPIAIKADAKLIDLFFPTMQLTIDVKENKKESTSSYKEFLIGGKMEHLINNDVAWQKWSSEIKYCGPAELWREGKGKPLHIGDTEFKEGQIPLEQPLIVYTGIAPKQTTDEKIKKYQVEVGDSIYLVINAGGRIFYSDKFPIAVESKVTIVPSNLEGEPNKAYTFTAKADFPPTGARYDWYVDGAKTQSNTSTSYSASFKTEGSHKVSVKLVDSAGKEIQEALAAVIIKATVPIKAATESTPALLRDCKYISFRLFPKAHCVHNFYKDDYYRSRETNTLESYYVVEKHIPVTWNGLNFSGKYKGKTDSAGNRERQTLFNDYILDCTINGSVSADGKAISKLKMTMIFTSASASFAETWEYEFTDIPFTAKVDKLQHRDPASRNLLMLYQVFDSNNPAAHGKFSATYQGKPESYVTLSDTSKTKMTDGRGTCFNCIWQNNSSTVTGPIKFGFTVTTASMNEL